MVERLVEHVERRLQQIVRQRLEDEPAVLLQGPRAVGKSTLLRDIASVGTTTVYDLDDLATRAAAAADPGLYAGAPPPVIIDEFQHVPELLDAIKAELNLDLAPGRFLLTGSTNYANLPRAAQSLTGRLHRIDVWPLSQGEMAGVEETFLDRAFDDPASLVSPNAASSTRSDYIERALRGGFPIAASRSGAARGRWFEDYVDLVIERDVVTLSMIQQRAELPRLLAKLASQGGQPLNIAKAAESIGLGKDTAERYTQLLEAVFLVHRLPAWGTTLRSRVRSVPKIHLRDSGLAAHLLGLDAAKLSRIDPASATEFGHLFETFCVNEILKQASWQDQKLLTGHWRTHDGDEVDLVIERRDGSVIAIEIKAGTRVQPKDLAAMERLRTLIGDAFVAGYVLHAGARSYSVGDRIHVLPAEAIWNAAG